MAEPSKRPKTSEAPRDEDRLKRLFAYIGDFGLESLNPHITKLVSNVTSLYDSHKPLILTLFLECICCLPHKAHIYAQVHTSLHAQIADWHASVMDVITQKIQETGENFTALKGIIRFWAYLVRLKVGNGDGLVDYIRKLIANSSPDSITRYGYLVILALFIAGEVLDSDTFLALLTSLEDAKKTRNTAFKPFATPLKGVNEDYFDWGLSCLKSLSSLNFRSEILPTYTLDETNRVTISDLPLPTPNFRLFPRFKIDFPVESTLCESDLWYMMDLMTDLMHTFQDSTELMSDTMLKTAESMNFMSAFGYLIVEEAVNKLSRFPTVLLSSLTIRSIPSSPDILKSLETTFTHFLRNSTVFDIETIDRISRFYSHVISNYQSVWNWNLIVPEELSDNGLFFLKTLINDLARLIEMDRLTAGLPEKLSIYFPLPQEPILRYADIEESVENTDCQLIIDRIQSKATGSMMKTLLSSKEICNSGDFLLQIFSECLFFQGAKSLLHVGTYLERYTDLMHTVKPEIILEALGEVWKKSGQKILIICKKLLQLGLIRPENVILFAETRIELGDKNNDWNRWEWGLIDLSLRLFPPGNSGLMSVVQWMGTVVSRVEEGQRGKVKARAGQLICAHREEVSAEMVQSVSGEMQTVLVGCKSMQVSS